MFQIIHKLGRPPSATWSGTYTDAHMMQAESLVNPRSDQTLKTLLAACNESVSNSRIYDWCIVLRCTKQQWHCCITLCKRFKHEIAHAILELQTNPTHLQRLYNIIS
jgi:hypothetical protein